ncbi:MAG: hypothetical protein N4A40_09910 [Tissierellales bacterium]|jgi:hypothetical protein|nr:hypothetical protein [Tissierellales bacterium]
MDKINRPLKAYPKLEPEKEVDVFTIIDATGELTHVDIPVNDLKSMTLGDYLLKQRELINSDDDLLDIDDAYEKIIG